MSDVIIDTNVVAVANRQDSGVTASCVDACIHFLIDVRKKHVVLLDAGDEIRKEYAGVLRMGRPYELGAQFLIHLLQQQWGTRRVRRVELVKDGLGAFVDFPCTPSLAAFDPSDRKFAALAKNTKTPVTNATDSDWVHSRAALEANGISINFLCGCDETKWHTT